MASFQKQSPLLLVGFLLSLSVSAPAGADTVENAVSMALQNHPAITSAQASLGAAGADKRSEFSGYFPELSLNASGGRMYGDNSTSRGLSVTRGAGYSNMWEGTAAATQMIFDGFETQGRVDAARAREKAANMDLMDVRESTALRATMSYIEVIRAYASLNLLLEQKNRVGDYLSRIKIAVDSGTSDEAEYQQALDVSAILSSYINDYEGQVRAAEANYFEVTGQAPDGALVQPVPNASLIPPSAEQAMAFARENHPLLRSMEYASQSAQSTIKSERAALYPDVNGELSYYKGEKDDILGGEAVDARAVLRANWNFETGGGQLSRIRKRQYEYETAKARVAETQRRVENNVRLAYSELQTAQNQLNIYDERAALNTRLMNTYEVQFQGGRVGLLQLMQADNQLFNTRLEKLNGEYRVLAAHYAVLASMGRLQESMMLGPSATGVLADASE